MTTQISEKTVIKNQLSNVWFYIFTAIAIVWSNVHYNGVAVIAASVFAIILIMLTLIDKKHMILPNLITVPGLVLGFISSDLFLHIGIINALIGAIVGFVLFAAISIIFEKITGKEGMGFGDVKLLAMLGAWCGAINLPIILLISSMLTIVLIAIRKFYKHTSTNTPIAYGPSLAIAGWLSLLYGPIIWVYILQIRQMFTDYLLRMFA